MMAKEIWKDVVGFEGYYEVSNLGRVRNARRGNILTGGQANNGYLRCTLRMEGKKYYKNIHRMVAEAFLPNPEGLECVNHIDEDKLNNNVDNLEWCTKAYNNRYGSKAREIVQYDFQGNVVATYMSVGVAAEAVNSSHHMIQKACIGEVLYVKGFMWGYKSA